MKQLLSIICLAVLTLMLMFSAAHGKGKIVKWFELVDEHLK